MDEQLIITYKGKRVFVRVDREFNAISHKPVYFIDLPRKTIYIEVGRDGTWAECEGQTNEEIREIGQLIEEAMK